MIVLGIDPGSRHTGYAVVEERGDRLHPLDYGRVSCPAKLALPSRLHHISSEIQKVIERNGSCRNDSDCVGIHTGTECSGSCGAYVNRKRADRVRRKIKRLDRKICGEFEEDGCTFQQVFCLATSLQPGCVDNRCAGVPVTPIPLPRPLPIDFRIKVDKRLDLKARP